MISAKTVSRSVPAAATLALAALGAPQSLVAQYNYPCFSAVGSICYQASPQCFDEYCIRSGFSSCCEQYETYCEWNDTYDCYTSENIESKLNTCFSTWDTEVNQVCNTKTGQERTDCLDAADINYTECYNSAWADFNTCIADNCEPVFWDCWEGIDFESMEDQFC